MVKILTLTEETLEKVVNDFDQIIKKLILLRKRNRSKKIHLGFINGSLLIINDKYFRSGIIGTNTVPEYNNILKHNSTENQLSELSREFAKLKIN